MKILCTGDIHMGRRSTRLPERLPGADFSSSRCWSAVVDAALEERVDLVALSGDVVDHENRYYEAVGPFEEGLRRLAAGGIRTVAVAGNHDYETLVTVAANFDPSAFTLLGRGGVWERLTVEGRDGAKLHVDGWSFPRPLHLEDPLREYAPTPPDGTPVLGILHGDLDAPGSRYAPVRLSDLRARAVGLWLLGHVHAPRLDERGVPVLYPGSPQALDPGEPGQHGAWIAEVDAAGRFALRQIPLSTARYEVVRVDVTGVERDDEVDLRVTSAVRETLRDVVEAGCGPLRCLSLRLRVVGRTPLHRTLRQRLERVIGDLELTQSEVSAVVERVDVDTSPAFELEALAGARGAPGILARLVMAIDAGTLDEEQERLVRAAALSASTVQGARPYRDLADDGGLVSAGRAREILREQAVLLLDGLIAQKEVAQ